METVLEVHNISRSFGAVQALDDVSLSVHRGEVHAIVGENGAGKSTLMNIISGKLQPSAGEILRNGVPLKFKSPREAQSAGICIAPQEISLARHLTVAENILLGAQAANRFGLIDWAETRRQAAQHLHQIDQTIDPSALVQSLTNAQQQIVQIARAVASSASVLIFDEPTAALASKETARLFDFIRRFIANGNAILYVSHRLDEIMALSHRISVLRDGRLVAEFATQNASKDEMVRHMAGRDVASLQKHDAKKIDDKVMLAVNGLTRPGEFENISFELHKGEILGIAGLIGAGRTELGKCLFGVTRAKAGTIDIEGRRVSIRHPADAIAAGLVYLPEERKQEGIFPLLSITENMTVSVFDKFRGLLGLRFSDMVSAVSDNVQKLQIKIGRPSDPITSLSGGNQQKVIIGRWLLRDSRILILDEPTRGIDVNAKFEIQSLLKSLADSGLSIIYISSELQELIDIADRILVMHEGRYMGTAPAENATQEGLLAMAMA
ncbi:MAG: sugar ABC transporter ATP-binding protein [Candidatus Competibacteraceae bacterium]|nr:sugar ABC transporter ATP-binding protein [Candidatus Competibacteraceae bacterium]